MRSVRCKESCLGVTRARSPAVEWRQRQRYTACAGKEGATPHLACLVNVDVRPEQRRLLLPHRAHTSVRGRAAQPAGRAPAFCACVAATQRPAHVQRAQRRACCIRTRTYAPRARSWDAERHALCSRIDPWPGGPIRKPVPVAVIRPRMPPHVALPPAAAVRFPAALPLLPFTPKEVLPPGSCKVLRLYEQQYNLLLEEILASPHQMFVHTAVEPSSKVDAARALGAYEAGGFTFFLSTIVKVVDVQQTERGVLLRVQSEGRVAVKSLAQTQPYFRAVAVPLTDVVSMDTMDAAAWREVSAAAAELKELMRDVQNLAVKFKAPESANLQRAMYWVDNPSPLLFNSSSLLLNSHDDHNRAAAADGGLGFQPGRVSSSIIAESDGPGSRPTLLDLERAVRLSLAAIQPLPRCSDAELANMRRRQQEALNTQDVVARLGLALEVMREARGLLSAKCALMAIAPAGQRPE